MRYSNYYFNLILLIEYPSNPPSIIVIIAIGIKDVGSFHPIINEDGKRTKNEIKIPFKIGFIFNSIETIKKPITIHIVNAEILASHVRFCKIIGITSMIPAMTPNNIPIIFLFFFQFLISIIKTSLIYDDLYEYAESNQ